MKKGSDTSVYLAQLLREAGYKATPRRVELLVLLSRAAERGKVLSINDLSSALKNHANQTTIYRALNDLLEAGIVRQVDFQHQHAHYEFIARQPHHHHLICKSCGDVEDVEACNTDSLEKKILKKSKKFSFIKTHALEFFSVCSNCISTS
jgi:Fur family ferric uptake transcriptional regulator